MKNAARLGLVLFWYFLLVLPNGGAAFSPAFPSRRVCGENAQVIAYNLRQSRVSVCVDSRKPEPISPVGPGPNSGPALSSGVHQ